MTEPKKWFSVPAGSIYTGRARDTLLRALRSGELVGHQRAGKHGHWAITRDALDAWMRGEVAEVTVPTVTRGRSAS